MYSFFSFELRLVNPRFKNKQVCLNLLLLKVTPSKNLIGKKPKMGIPKKKRKSKKSMKTNQATPIGLVIHKAWKVDYNQLNLENLSKVSVFQKYNNRYRIS